MPLVTVQDLAKALNTTYTADSPEEAQAQYFCDLAESYISEELDMVFTEQIRTERMQADYDGIIQLTVYPVSVVSSVNTITGLVRTGWSFDGIDEIDGLEAHEVVDVTYTAGTDTPPVALRNLAASIASRLAVNPSGIRQQTVGAISETYAASSGDAGTVYFTRMEREILDRYRTVHQTWRLGPRSRSWRTDGVLPTL